jgi:hypothetical protein
MVSNHDIINTTHPVIASPSVRKDGLREMIGVEETTKRRKSKWLSYL